MWLMKNIYKKWILKFSQFSERRQRGVVTAAASRRGYLYSGVVRFGFGKPRDQ